MVSRIETKNREELRKLSDSLRSQAQKTVWILLCRSDEKIYFVVGLSADIKNGSLDARELAKRVASLIEGSGGGRQDLAEGGGTNGEALSKNWQALIQSAKDYLKGKN